MAIAPKNTTATLDPQTIEGQTQALEDAANRMRHFNTGISQTLLNVALPRDLFDSSIGPQESKALSNVVNAHLYQVHNTISNPDGDFQNSINEQAPGVNFGGIDLGSVDLDYKIGGRSLAAQQAFGTQNVGPIYQNPLATTNLDDGSSAELKILVKPDGGVNSSFALYVRDAAGQELYSTGLEQNETKVITQAKNVEHYIQAVQASQSLRIQSGLPADDILRNLSTGLPESFAQLDNVYPKLPPQHPHHGITPYTDLENRFLRDMFSTMYEKQIVHDYGQQLVRADQNKKPLADVEMPIELSTRKALDRAGFMLETKDLDGNPLTSNESISINVNRTTHRNQRELMAFLANDPEMQQRMRLVNETLQRTPPETTLSTVLSTDTNPDIVKFQNINLDASVFNPNHANYQKFSKDSELSKVGDVYFDLDGTKDINTVLFVQGKENIPNALTILGKSQSDLLAEGIAVKATDNLTGLTQAAMLDNLRALYVQNSRFRNDGTINLKDVDNAKQTIFMVDRATQIELNSFRTPYDVLARSNVAFISPSVGENTWESAIQNENGKLVPEKVNNAREYLQQKLSDFEVFRGGLLSQSHPDFMQTIPASKVDSVLDKTIGDFLVQQELKDERLIRAPTTHANLELQAKAFEGNQELIMGVLKNEATRNTISGMLAFAKDEMDLDKFKPVREALSREIGINEGADANMNIAVIANIGRLLVQNHISKNNPDYVADPANPAYDQTKKDTIQALSDQIRYNEKLSPTKREGVAERMIGIVSNFEATYPNVDDQIALKVINSLEMAASSLRQTHLYNLAGLPPPEMAVGQSVYSNPRADISPLKHSQVEFTAEAIQSYAFFAEKSEGLFAMSGSKAAASLFAATPEPAVELAAEAAVEIKNDQPWPRIPLHDGPGYDPLPDINESNSIIRSVADQIAFNPVFQDIKEAIKNGEAYKMPSKDIVKLIPELGFFDQIQDKPVFEPHELQEITQAQPMSAAASAGLLYGFANVIDMKEIGTLKKGEERFQARDPIEYAAADYPNEDLMYINILVDNLEQFRNTKSIEIKLDSIESEGADPEVEEHFEQSLRGYFAGGSNDADGKAPSVDTPVNQKEALSINMYERTLEDFMSIKKVDPALAIEINRLVEGPEYQSVATNALDTSAPSVSEVAPAAAKAEPDVVLDNSQMIDSIKRDPRFTTFMEKLRVEQIETDNNKYTSASFDLPNTIKNAFPMLENIDTSKFEPADPKSMIAQLQIEGTMHQKHGKIDPKPLHLTKFNTFEDAVVAYMADNVEYLNAVPTIKLASAKMTSGVDTPEAKAVMKELESRGMGVAHPDMHKMGVAEFADKHFPDMINGKEFDSFRDTPRPSVVNQTEMTLIVSNEVGALREYKLSDYNSPQELADQQKADFRQNDRGLKVEDIRCHSLAQDAVAALFQTSKEPMSAHPNLLPQELWTQGTKDYLSNDSLIKPTLLTSTQIEVLGQSADSAYTAQFVAPKEPDFVKAAEPSTAPETSKPEVEKDNTREISSPSFDSMDMM